jgi:hypothetical protein
MDTFYPIGGKYGPHKIVSVYHTNKHLSNFHWDIIQCVDMIYDKVKAGAYIAQRGYQNGYGDIGYMLVIVEEKYPCHLATRILPSQGRDAGLSPVRGTNLWAGMKDYRA